MTKVCSRCQLEQPLVEYTVTDQRTERLRTWCKACERVRGRAFYAAHPEHREKVKVASANWAKNNPERWTAIRRKMQLKHHYGLSQGQYNAILSLQGFRCALCGSETPGRTGQEQWHVDHNHETGAVRGLLCHSCNVRLGSYETLLQIVGETALKAYQARNLNDVEPAQTIPFDEL